jgi:ParB-like nuclease domain
VSGGSVLLASTHQLLEIHMEHTKELLSINLSNLVPSPFNVRRHSPGQVEELAALIGSQGLVYPLIVTEHIAGRCCCCVGAPA